MSINFPNSPAPGDSFTAEGATFVWTGSLWVVPTAPFFATEAEAEAGERADRAMSPLTSKEAIAALHAGAPAQEAFEAICVAYCIFVAGPTLVQAVNIAGVTGTGIYDLTFVTPRPSTNYLILGLSEGITNHPVLAVCPDEGNKTVNGFRIRVGTTGGTGSTGGFTVNSSRVHVGVFAWD